MNTKTKIFLASIISKILIFFRNVVGKKQKLKCIRNDLNWELNLSEGIDLSIYLFGSFETNISKSLEKIIKKKSSTIIDIGANIGSLSLYFAKQIKSGLVYAIEPTDYAYSKLLKNIKLNPALSKKLLPFQIMLTERKKIKPKTIHSSWNLKNSTSSHKIHKGILKPLKKAKTETLDQFVKKNKIRSVDVIKLDVDGYELNVLKSGKKFLTKHKPLIIMEIAPYLYPEFGYSAIDLCNFTLSLGYKIYDINFSKIENINQFISSITHGSSKNVIFK